MASRCGGEGVAASWTLEAQRAVCLANSEFDGRRERPLASLRKARSGRQKPMAYGRRARRLYVLFRSHLRQWGRKMVIPAAIKRLAKLERYWRYIRLHAKYRNFTMIPASTYAKNLMLVRGVRSVAGCVVECGTWRGGMIAGIADVLGPEREYFLFDSFEGLPPPRDIDGAAARAWQADVNGPLYYNNGRASEDEARQAMHMSSARRFTVVKGWFDRTLPQFAPPAPIALLRIDADWYDSVKVCLTSLHARMAEDGLIIIDDYGAWDGCVKATHEFLHSLNYREDVPRLRQYWNDVYYVAFSSSRLDAKVPPPSCGTAPK